MWSFNRIMHVQFIFISSIPWPCINVHKTSKQSLHPFLYLLNWYIEASLILSRYPLPFSYFHIFNSHLICGQKLSNLQRLKNVWHVLWERDMALVIAHFWICHLCVLCHPWELKQNGSWFWVKCLVKDMSGDVHLFLCICTVCACVNENVSLSAFNCTC